MDSNVNLSRIELTSQFGSSWFGDTQDSRASEPRTNSWAIHFNWSPLTLSQCQHPRSLKRIQHSNCDLCSGPGTTSYSRHRDGRGTQATKIDVRTGFFLIFQRKESLTNLVAWWGSLLKWLHFCSWLSLPKQKLFRERSWWEIHRFFLIFSGSEKCSNILSAI